MRRNPDGEDVLYIEDDEDRLFDEPDWTLDELWPSLSDSLRPSVCSAFCDLKTACPAGVIWVSTDVQGLHSLRHQGIQAFAYLRSRYAA